MGIFAELRRFVLAYRACGKLRCDAGSGHARRNPEVKGVRAIVTAAHRPPDFPSSGRRSTPRPGRGDAPRDRLPGWLQLADLGGPGKGFLRARGARGEPYADTLLHVLGVAERGCLLELVTS